MKIYFAGSIRGGRQHKEIYLEIINFLKGYGKVLTEHIGSQDLDHLGEKGLTEKEIYDRDMKWLNEADVLVADVSVPSLGVGYEIATAQCLKKPILCICKKFDDEKKLSSIILGDNKIKTEYYQTTEDVQNILEEFLKK